MTLCSAPSVLLYYISVSISIEENKLYKLCHTCCFTCSLESRSSTGRSTDHFQTLSSIFKILLKNFSLSFLMNTVTLAIQGKCFYQKHTSDLFQYQSIVMRIVLFPIFSVTPGEDFKELSSADAENIVLNCCVEALSHVQIKTCALCKFP